MRKFGDLGEALPPVPVNCTIFRRKQLGDSHGRWYEMVPQVTITTQGRRKDSSWTKEMRSRINTVALMMLVRTPKDWFVVWHSGYRGPAARRRLKAEELLASFLKYEPPPTDVLGVQPWSVVWPPSSPYPLVAMSGSMGGAEILHNLEGVFGPVDSPRALSLYAKLYNRQHPAVVQVRADSSFTVWARLA